MTRRQASCDGQQSLLKGFQVWQVLLIGVVPYVWGPFP